MFHPTHRIRWKRPVEVRVLTDWSQDTGLCNSHIERREEGQAEDVCYRDSGQWPTVQMHLAEEFFNRDSSSGRMLDEVSRADFEVVRRY